MSASTAKTVEARIIGLCIAALVLIFQPFSKLLSGFGMALVVLGGLAFNLVPLCEPGRPARSLVRAALIVVVVFVVVLPGPRLRAALRRVAQGAAGLSAQRLRPSNLCGVSVSRSTPSTQRTLIAAIALPSGEVA